MDSHTLHQFFAPVSHFAAGHVHEIAAAVVATGLAVFSGNINRQIKRRIGHRHFVVRTAAFIGMCAFGYGLLAVLATGWLALLLAHCDALVLLALVVAAFVTLGILAERKKCI